MVAKNDITGDSIQTRAGLSEQGKANWDTIFPPKKRERYVPPPLNLEGTPATPDKPMEPPKSVDDWDEDRMDVVGTNGNDGLHY